MAGVLGALSLGLDELSLGLGALSLGLGALSLGLGALSLLTGPLSPGLDKLPLEGGWHSLFQCNNSLSVRQLTDTENT
jgi:hypothetical protein